MELVKYQPAYDSQWDDFVINHTRNGSIFTERKFLSYHKDRFSDASLMFYKSNKLIAVFPAAVQKSDSVPGIVSHPGSSSGGLIYEKYCKTRDILIILELLISYYRDQEYNFIELTINEPIFDYPSSDELRFLLWHRGFKLKTKELSSCIPLDSNRQWLKFGRKKNKTDINRLVREGFAVEMSDDIKEIYPLIYDNLKIKYNKEPTHSLKELRLLKSLYPDRIHFWKVHKDSRIAAVTVLFLANKSTVHDFYIAENSDFANINIMPLLFYTMFDHYYQTGFRWFNFGISTRKDWIKWGILEFKERLGGRASIRESYILQDLKNYSQYNFY